MTSVRFEEEKVSSQRAEEEQEGRNVLPGFLSDLSVFVTPESLGTKLSKVVRKVFFLLY